MTLNPRWTAHIRDKERKETFANTILNSRIIADRLRVITQEEIEAIERSEGSDQYDSPSWSHKQAHRNGYYRAMKLLQKLLDFDQETTKGQTNAPRE